jgi:hypothetical protein
LKVTDYSPTTVRTPDEAAKRLLHSEKTLQRWRAQGTGPRFVKIGGRIGYRDPDLDAFIDASVRSPTGRPAVKRARSSRR